MIGGDIRSVRERPTVVSVILCALITWLSVMVQVGFFQPLPICGATVELTFAIICYVGWRRGALTGAVAGVVGGATLDALTSTGVSVLPVLMMLAGIYMALAAEHLFDRPLTYLLALLPAYAVLGGYRALIFGRFSHVFAVMLCGYLASVVIYIPAAIRYFRRAR